MAQIKLAQEAKLQEVSQSCTTLTTQCLDDANKTITDFDARALSIFGVKADVTINEMCSDIKNMCTGLMAAISTENKPAGEKTDWTSGMDAIATEKSYATILSTCREVGKNCIIQACTAISGNFGLCENIDTSINRKSIVSRRACWNEVEQCIRDAGSDTISAIMAQEKRKSNESGGDIYQDLYGLSRQDGKCNKTATEPTSDLCITYNNESSDDITIRYDSSGNDLLSAEKDEIKGAAYKNIYYLYDWCQVDAASATTKWTELDWEICRLTEQIWGNCETRPGNEFTPRNQIIINNEINPDNETLLSWFARNTNTEEEIDSCRDTSCGYGFENSDGECIPVGYKSNDGLYCPESESYTRITTTSDETNCCDSRYYDKKEQRTTAIAIGDSKKPNMCCIYGATTSEITKDTNYASDGTTSSTPVSQICNPTSSTLISSATTKLVFTVGNTDYYCVGGTLDTSEGDLNCKGGKWVAINTDDKTYSSPTLGTSNVTDLNFYYTDGQNSTTSTPDKNTTGWLVGKL